MKVAIFGAGSVGCFIGGAWASAGVPVTFVGRERIGREIEADGLTLTDFSGCDDYDTKPIELPRLLGKMEELLTR